MKVVRFRFVIAWVNWIALVGTFGIRSLAAEAGSDRPVPRRFEPGPPVAPVTQAPIQVLVSKRLLDHGRVSYRYRVINGSPFPIGQLSIGEDREAGAVELVYVPLGWDPDSTPAVPSGSLDSPPGWNFEVIPTEEDSLCMVDWVIARPDAAILGGTSLGGFSVILPTEDEAYERGHWTTILTRGDSVAWSQLIQPEGRVPLPAGSIQAHAGVTIRYGSWGDSVFVEFKPPAPGKAGIEIFDSGGSHVTRIGDGLLPSGLHRAIWTGRDDSGGRVKPGRYFVAIYSPHWDRNAEIGWPPPKKHSK